MTMPVSGVSLRSFRLYTGGSVYRFHHAIMPHQFHEVSRHYRLDGGNKSTGRAYCHLAPVGRLVQITVQFISAR